MTAAQARASARPSFIQRFNFVEIVVHWLTVGAFIVELGTGLAFSYPRLYWLTTLFGGGQTSREIHPWAGIAFSVGIVLMAALWVRDMLPERSDGAWFRGMKEYVTLSGKEADVGRFNPGQKLFYGIMFIATAALFATGLFIWQVSWAGADIRSWMRFFHSMATVLALGMFLIHGYMGTAMYPGTFGGMLHGKVTRGWAMMHHSRWYRERYARK